MSRHAVLDGDGNIINVILLEPGSEYDPGPGLSTREVPETVRAQVGGKFNSNKNPTDQDAWEDAPYVEPDPPYTGDDSGLNDRSQRPS